MMMEAAPARRRIGAEACLRCHLGHLACDEARPCRGCMRAGVECEVCPDDKKRRKKNMLALRKTNRSSENLNNYSEQTEYYPPGSVLKEERKNRKQESMGFHSITPKAHRHNNNNSNKHISLSSGGAVDMSAAATLLDAAAIAASNPTKWFPNNNNNTSTDLSVANNNNSNNNNSSSRNAAAAMAAAAMGIDPLQFSYLSPHQQQQLLAMGGGGGGGSGGHQQNAWLAAAAAARQQQQQQQQHQQQLQQQLGYGADHMEPLWRAQQQQQQQLMGGGGALSHLAAASHIMQHPQQQQQSFMNPLHPQAINPYGGNPAAAMANRWNYMMMQQQQQQQQQHQQQQAQLQSAAALFGNNPNAAAAVFGSTVASAAANNSNNSNSLPHPPAPTSLGQFPSASAPQQQQQQPAVIPSSSNLPPTPLPQQASLNNNSGSNLDSSNSSIPLSLDSVQGQFPVASRASEGSANNNAPSSLETATRSSNASFSVAVTSSATDASEKPQVAATAKVGAPQNNEGSDSTLKGGEKRKRREMEGETIVSEQKVTLAASSPSAYSSASSTSSSSHRYRSATTREVTAVDIAGGCIREVLASAAAASSSSPPLNQEDMAKVQMFRRRRVRRKHGSNGNSNPNNSGASGSSSGSLGSMGASDDGASTHSSSNSAAEVAHKFQSLPNAKHSPSNGIATGTVASTTAPASSGAVAPSLPVPEAASKNLELSEFIDEGLKNSCILLQKQRCCGCGGEDQEKEEKDDADEPMEGEADEEKKKNSKQQKKRIVALCLDCDGALCEECDSSRHQVAQKHCVFRASDLQQLYLQQREESFNTTHDTNAHTASSSSSSSSLAHKRLVLVGDSCLTCPVCQFKRGAPSSSSTSPSREEQPVAIVSKAGIFVGFVETLQCNYCGNYRETVSSPSASENVIVSRNKPLFAIASSSTLSLFHQKLAEGAGEGQTSSSPFALFHAEEALNALFPTESLSNETVVHTTPLMLDMWHQREMQKSLSVASSSTDADVASVVFRIQFEQTPGRVLSSTFVSADLVSQTWSFRFESFANFDAASANTIPQVFVSAIEFSKNGQVLCSNVIRSHPSLFAFIQSLHAASSHDTVLPLDVLFHALEIYGFHYTETSLLLGAFFWVHLHRSGVPIWTEETSIAEVRWKLMMQKNRNSDAIQQQESLLSACGQLIASMETATAQLREQYSLLKKVVDVHADTRHVMHIC